MLEVVSHADEVRRAVAEGAGKGAIIIGFFGDFSAASKEARPAFEKFCADNPDQRALLVDVLAVRGVHKDFGVTGVPTVIAVRDGRVLRKVEGVQSAEGYDRALLSEATVVRTRKDDDKPAHRVVVYTGPHCPWCVRVKSYLRKNRIRFREIDVSSDPAQARELQARSGHTGVPQLDIDGHWVIGFDQPAIDRLLGLRAAS